MLVAELPQSPSATTRPESTNTSTCCEEDSWLEEDPSGNEKVFKTGYSYYTVALSIALIMVLFSAPTGIRDRVQDNARLAASIPPNIPTTEETTEALLERLTRGSSDKLLQTKKLEESKAFSSNPFPSFTLQPLQHHGNRQPLKKLAAIGKKSSHWLVPVTVAVAIPGMRWVLVVSVIGRVLFRKE